MPRSAAHLRSVALANADLRKTIQFLSQTQQQLRERHRQMVEFHARMTVSRQRYRYVFENAPVGYIILNSAGRILECNRMATKMLGNRTVLQGMLFLNMILVTDRPLFEGSFRRCLQGRSVPTLELSLCRGLAENFPVQLAFARAPAGEQKDARDIRLSMVDLTELKTVQTQLQLAKENVEQRVEDRTRELSQSNEELAREIARRTRLEGQLLEISERERRLFGQDLHDDTCQALTGLALEFGALSRKLEREGVKLAPQFRHMAASLNTLAENTRRIARGLHPVCLGGGLLLALEELANHTSRRVPCTFEGDLSGITLPPEVELALYRIAQEALSNAAKHAEASRVTVRLWQKMSILHLTIEDDGVGLPKAPKAKAKSKSAAKLTKPMPKLKGMGLDILSYRARSIGATLTVADQAGGGVRVDCELPFSALPVAAIRGKRYQRG